jgi:hypothetical protein
MYTCIYMYICTHTYTRIEGALPARSRARGGSSVPCVDGDCMEGGSRATHGPSAIDAVNALGLPDGEIILRLISVCVRTERSPFSMYKVASSASCECVRVPGSHYHHIPRSLPLLTYIL